MNDPHANAGFAGLTGTEEIEVACQGFTPTTDDFEVAAIEFPAARGGRAYTGDADFVIASEYVKGQYYPIPFVSITLAAGEAFGWLDS